MIVPFPFLLIVVIVTFGLIIVKFCRVKTRLIYSLIAFLSVVELLLWTFFLVQLGIKSFKWPTGIIGFVLFLNLMQNITFGVFFLLFLRKDEGIGEFRNKYKCIHYSIILLSILVWHRLYRLSYCFISGLKPLGGWMKHYWPFYLILQIASVFCSVLALIAAGLNFYTMFPNYRT